MASTATVHFLAADGNEVCTLKLYEPANWKVAAGLDAIELVAAAQAQDAGEATVQLLEGVRYEYELTVSGYELALGHQYSNSQDVVLRSSLARHVDCGTLKIGRAHV